jgi:hypothetical protein
MYSLLKTESKTGEENNNPISSESKIIPTDKGGGSIFKI